MSLTLQIRIAQQIRHATGTNHQRKLALRPRCSQAHASTEVFVVPLELELERAVYEQVHGRESAGLGLHAIARLSE